MLASHVVIDGRFELMEVLGRGGMGVVHRALDRASGEHVAFKLLLPDILRSAKGVARFEREIAVLRRIDHPNAVKYVAHGTTPAGEVWVAMTLAAGAPFKKLVAACAERRDQELLVAVLQVLRDTAAALVEAHRVGAVHRDLKPDNILAEGTPPLKVRGTVLDFGIATIMDGDQSERLTTTGKIIGTPAYMAPEQVLGQSITDRCDVWALGVILYAAIHGRPPWTGDIGAVLRGIVTNAVPVTPDGAAPECVRSLIAKCLVREPAARPPAGEVVRLVDACLSQLGPSDTVMLDATQHHTVISEPATTIFAEPLKSVSPAFPQKEPTRSGAAGTLDGTLITGKYRILGTIAEGGNGVVFRAVNIQTEGLVAVKCLKPGMDADPAQAERLKREVRTLAKLCHPNTVRVYDCGETDTGELFVVMELLRGRPLSDVLRRDGPLPVSRALAIARQVLAALEEAHEHGVIHRDLKPPNIIILDRAAGPEGSDSVKLIDFGIAKQVEGTQSSLTADNAALGTPTYMAPEQIVRRDGWTIGPRTDLYAVGVLLYEMIAGHPPFRADSAMALLYQHLNEPAPRLDAPAPIADLVASLLEKEPSARPATVTEVLRRLDAIHADTAAAAARERPVAGEPPPPPTPVLRQRTGTALWRWLVPTVGAVAVAVVVALWAGREHTPEPTKSEVDPSPPSAVNLTSPPNPRPSPPMPLRAELPARGLVGLRDAEAADRHPTRALELTVLLDSGGIGPAAASASSPSTPALSDKPVAAAAPVRAGPIPARNLTRTPKGPATRGGGTVFKHGVD